MLKKAILHPQPRARRDALFPNFVLARSMPQRATSGQEPVLAGLEMTGGMVRLGFSLTAAALRKRRVLARLGWVGELMAFLNILIDLT